MDIMRHAFFLSLLAAFLLTGCTTHHHYRVGVSQCLDDAWRQKMNEEMELELLLHPEMSLSKRIAYGSNELQCAQIDSFIAERVDLLIVSPNEAEAVKPAVSRAFRAGIPVIVADRRVPGEEWTAFIGGDNTRVGTLMADWILSIQANRTTPLHVLEVSGLPGSTPASLRHTGMMTQLAQSDGVQPFIASVMGAWYQQNAYDSVRQYLARHKDVDVIVAQNDLMAIGASEAVRDSKGYGKGSVRIMGVDGIMLGLQAISNEQIECTATYSSRGDMIIETAFRILTNAPYVRDKVLETTMIDRVAAKALLFKWDERQHEMETMYLLRTQQEQRWHKMQISRIILVIILVFIALLFCQALWYLFSRQKKIQSEIVKTIIPQLEEVQETIQLNHRDVAFSERLKQVVDEHLTDSNLNVEFLGSMFQLSRTQIFRRVKTVTGKGPLEYIRERRLLRADELLRNTDMTVQQVAMELCFSSPGYFTKCYKEQFGHLPSTR